MSPQAPQHLLADCVRCAQCKQFLVRHEDCCGAGWVGLKTLVAGLTKSKGEGDIPSHVDDLRCLSLVFSGNSAVRTQTPCLWEPTPQLLVPSCSVLAARCAGRVLHGTCDVHPCHRTCARSWPLLQVHLELPPGGNGRSRDEWVAAFQDLTNGAYKALLQAATH